MPDNHLQPRFKAVVLAGERRATNPLAEHGRVCCKAMLEVAGTPMIERVLAALDNAEQVNARLISGPARDQLAPGSTLEHLIETGKIDWCEPQPTPSTSAWHAMQTVPVDTPVLLTTADHPVLSAKIVDQFCTASAAANADVTIGLAPYDLVRQAFPDMKKTVLHFKDGDYCGCNLFTFLTPEGRGVANYWRQVENERKRPLKVIRTLGLWAVLQYLLGQLTLDRATERLSHKLGLRIRAIRLPYAEAAVDVDSIEDHRIVQRKLASGELS